MRFLTVYHPLGTSLQRSKLKTDTGPSITYPSQALLINRFLIQPTHLK